MKIEIMRIFSESFKSVREHKMEWLRVATAPILVWLFGFFFMAFAAWASGHPLWSMETLMQEMQGKEPLEDLSFMMILGNTIYYVAYLIATVTVMVNGYRYAALKEGGDTWWTLNLNWRFIKFILYYLLVGLIALVYVGLSVGIIFGANALIGNVAVNVILGLGLVVLGGYGMLRLVLTFFLIAIDQTTPLRVSWALLKGNIMRLLGLFLLIMLVIILISIAGLVIFGVLTWILSMIMTGLSFLGLALMFAFFVVVWLLSWAVSAKAISLVYRTFTEGKAF